MKFTIKQARMLVGLSQKDMGERLGISRSTYISLENGEQYIRVDQMYKFSEITGLPIRDIKFYEEVVDVK